MVCTDSVEREDARGGDGGMDGWGGFEQGLGVEWYAVQEYRNYSA